MRSSRALVLATILVAPALLSGCVVKDWLDYQGTLRVRVESADPSTQAIDRFQTLQVGIRAAQAKPLNEIRDIIHEGHRESVVLDLVQQAGGGAAVEVMNQKFRMKPIERVTLLLVLKEAVTVDGTRLPGCVKDDQGETVERPCIAVSPGGTYVFQPQDGPVEMKRAGTTVIDFPLAVMCVDMANERAPCTAGTPPADTEYFLQSRPSEATVSYP